MIVVTPEVFATLLRGGLVFMVLFGLGWLLAWAWGK